MANRWTVGCVLAVALLVPGVGSGGRAVRGAEPETPEIQVQRALDEPLTLSLEGVSIAEAFKQINAKTKIPLTVDPTCYELLPYGETTRVSVTFNQSKLREALDVLLIPVGLQANITGKEIVIRPSSPLQHIGHRADWEELQLLKDLWSSPDLKAPAAGAGAGGTFSLPEAIRAAMAAAVPPQTPRPDIQVLVPGDAAGGGALSQAHYHAIDQIAHQLPMSAYRALDIYCQMTGNIWFVQAGKLAGGPAGGTVVIMSPRQWIERQLAQPIQISHNKEPLEVVVSDLAHASGIHFVPEPGLYQAVPAVSLTSNNATVRQTLETLAGMTRIAFDIRDDSILLHLATGAEGVTPAKADSIVGRISVAIGPDGAMMDVYIKESDLTPAQNELRKQHIAEAVKAMVKTWTTPATGTGPGGAASRPE